MPTRITSGGGSSDAHGTDPKPTGINAHAEGKSTSATGASAHAEGLSTQATGTASHAEGSATTASGASGSHSEGAASLASGQYAHAENDSTTASGQSAHAQGQGTTASGWCAHAEGNTSTASGDASHAQGVQAAATRLGQHAQAAGAFAAAGDAQTSVMVLTKTTTDATPAVVTAQAGAVDIVGSDANVLTIPVSRAHRFRIEALARNTGADQFAAWTITGTIVRHSSGNARFIATPVTVTEADAAAAAWTLAVSVNTGDATNNYLAITATGEAAKTIRWVARVEFTEVG